MKSFLSFVFALVTVPFGIIGIAVYAYGCKRAHVSGTRATLNIVVVFALTVAVMIFLRPYIQQIAR
jgi:hypothetical protein